ncbi:MAG: hypothetical protein ACTS2F_29865 [Thainema sp.]
MQSKVWQWSAVSLVAVLGWPGVPTQTLAQSTQFEAWQQVLNWWSSEDRRRGYPGTGKPGEMCILNPGKNEVVWHDQPLLLWRSTAHAVGIRTLTDETEVWRATGEYQALGFRGIQMTQPLEPGESYAWYMLYREQSPNPFDRPLPFTLMNEEQRHVIATELEALEADLEATGATVDQLALAKVDYFLEQDLRTDAVQVMFSVEEPSEELMTLREEWITEICAKQMGDDESS